MVKLTDKKIAWIVRNVAGEKVSTKKTLEHTASLRGEPSSW